MIADMYQERDVVFCPHDSAAQCRRRGRDATKLPIRAAEPDECTRVRGQVPQGGRTLEKDADVLLTFFDFPAGHGKHLRTSNVNESPFATVRLRQRVTKGAGSRTKGLLMAYKSGDSARGGGGGV